MYWDTVTANVVRPELSLKKNAFYVFSNDSNFLTESYIG